MPSVSLARFLLVILEAFFWIFIPLIFIFIYIRVYGASIGFVNSHFSILFSFFVGLCSLRILIWRFLSFAGVKIQKIIITCIIFIPLFFLLIWYVCILIGLSSWGRIATWSLVKIYLIQGFQLLDVLGFSYLAIFFAGMSVALIGLFFYKLFSFDDWCYGISRYFSATALVVISMLGLAVFGVQLYRLCKSIDMHPQEPISISLFEGGSSSHQSHALAISPVVDAAEDAAFSSYQAVPKFKARNVVLIVGDALRADHMGIYGYYRNTTPKLDISSGNYQTLVVSSVRSVCGESSCGLRAIASSRPLHLFPNNALTLHEVLRRHGYDINLFFSGDHTNFYGLKELYGRADNYFDGVSQSSRYVNDDMLLVDRVKEVQDFDGLRPHFFQFHLMSTHGLGLRHEDAERFQPFINYYRWPALVGGRVAPSLEDVPKAINYYDNGVYQFDAVASAILDALSKKGYLKDALVIFTADHGEMLGEKGVFGHQRRVDEEVLHVPLIIQRRGYSGDNLSEWPLSSQVDIAPSILVELGIRLPDVWVGVSLQSPAAPRFIFFQQAPRAGIYIVESERSVFKYWKDFSTGDEYLYDLYLDPKEFVNIIEKADSADLQLWRDAVIKSVVSKKF